MTSSHAVMPTNGLRGPHASDAQRMLAMSARLSKRQAQELAAAWESDPNPHYDLFCEVVQGALISTDRRLPMGWFEAYFADQEWLEGTKALHAIADAVVATLVRDDIPHEIFHALVRPWAEYMSEHAAHKVDLRRIKEICLI